MSLTYTLTVSGSVVHTGTFDDTQALAADVIARAGAYGDVGISPTELAALIDSDTGSTIDLRLLPPQITVEVSAL